MKTHPAARHARHLYKVASRAADMFGQLGNVLSHSGKSPEHLNLLLLETVGRLYKELGSWRKHLAVASIRSGISQRAIADALQVSRRTIQLWVQETDRAGEQPATHDDCLPSAAVETVRFVQAEDLKATGTDS